MEFGDLMKALQIASIGFAVLFMVTPGANAQQATTTVSLVPKLQPVTFSHPGVSADVLGIRIGMTVSQVEAILKKSYPGGPSQVIKRRDSFAYRGVTVQSNPYVQTIIYDKSMAHGGSDALTVYFTGPATGNRLNVIHRNVLFNSPPYGEPNPLLDPSTSALKAGVMKKYGPPSFRPPGSFTWIWAFTQKSQLSSKNLNNMEMYSYSDVAAGEPSDLTGLNVGSGCGVGNTTKYSNVFLINARFTVNGIDKTKADGLKIAIWDPPACMNDERESIEQLKADAIKAYKSVSAPAAPKL